MTERPEVRAGAGVVVGGRVVPMPECAPGDRLVALPATGELLVIPREDDEVARAAVERAHEAFRALATVSDDAVTAFFEGFAHRLGDDATWGAVAEANTADVDAAKERGRSTTRLVATEKMRQSMIDGLLGWAKAPSRRGEVLERREGPDWTVERRRAPLGVVAFVFEGRPNVLADGVGVLRGGNTSVMRIGSDALRTAGAIEANVIQPALHQARLPEGAVVLVRSASHGAAHALFSTPAVRLAVARGSGLATALLGAIATQHGIPVSLHGTGGAWLYLADDAPADTAHNAIIRSLDRKVCNTLNTVVVARRRAHELVPLLLDALRERDPNYRLHVAVGSEHDVPTDLFAKRVPVRRAEGEVAEAQVDAISVADLSREWEWEQTPEVSLVGAGTDEEAVALVNTHSPRFVASIVTADPARFERFYELVDAPYVGDGFTRWVDGQWAWGRPELGLSNWERGRLWGRSGILTGEDVYAVRDVFRDRTEKATQER